ncbi:MAG: NAD(P)/FAD-dependent oxidoreductase [Desulfobacteraceae bacterium]|nr:NAD(P)/FAD-dependent oxidoreductase [Desulfobacteraceae bacterium]
MTSCKYLIVGCSHAGMSAAEAIRVRDDKGSITMLTREDLMPYSPTILPYVISGRTRPLAVFLKDEDEMARLKIDFRQAATVSGVNPSDRTVTLASGDRLAYEKLLLATGSLPATPPFPGIESIPYHTLRTVDDALRLKDAMAGTTSAIVLGAGLIAIHAAENLATAGVKVTVIVRSRLLRGYFDDQAGDIIRQILAAKGITVIGDALINRIEDNAGKCMVVLDGKPPVTADLLVAATGISPCIGYLDGSGIRTENGVVVDETMRASVKDVWAAGDVAQARGFFDEKTQIDATLPSAMEQGRMAGMDMVDDKYLKHYIGGLSLNTYNFFGHRAFSIGFSSATEGISDADTDVHCRPADNQFQKFIFQDNRLVGASAINTRLDPGVMYQLVRRRVDLTPDMSNFLADPVSTGRLLMSEIWR